MTQLLLFPVNTDNPLIWKESLKLKLILINRLHKEEHQEKS